MATSLELAITAIRSNRKDEGRQLLNLLIQENPNNETAWLWMSSVVDTDEQRARCLYHVLAINPNNQTARRGLQLLGIVVSDSRPVKVPRDSQPIQIPMPSPPNTNFAPPTDSRPLPAQQPMAQATSAEERRPFRIDPQAVVDELPFKPITKPFTTAPQNANNNDTPPQQVGAQQVEVQQTEAGQNVTAPSVNAQPVGQVEQIQTAPPSTPVPVVKQTDISTNQMEAVAQPQPQAAPQQAHIIPIPINNTANVINPSEPVPVVQTNHTVPNPVQQPTMLPPQVNTDSGPVPVSPAPQQMNPGGQFYPQQFTGTPMPVQDTRPSQPVMPIQQNPSQPVQVLHTNATAGMPTQQPPMQDPSQPMNPIHANATMAMQNPNGQMQNPSEPVPVIHTNATVNMPTYGQPQLQQQQPQPQNYAVHSNSTMAMPMGAMPMMANQSPMVDYRVANAMGMSNPTLNQANNDDDEDDEINILAVIIFGSLSVTALGGLGMLILLMFAA